MALFYYIGMLAAAVLAVTLGIAGVLGPAPPSSPIAVAPTAAAAAPSASEPAEPSRAGQWGPRVAPVPDWNEKAAAAAAQSAAAARQRAQMELGRQQVSTRGRAKLPDVITRRDDDAGSSLGYARPPPRFDRFRIY